MSSDEPDQPAPGASSAPGAEAIGSAAEEAARLFAALSGWAQGHVGDVNEHIATGAAECTYCPICRTVHLIREVSPEVRDHFLAAGASLMQAVTGLMADFSSGAPTDRSATVERINLDTLDTDWPDP